MAELHLIVLWEYARPQEDRILEDIPRHVDVICSTVLEWPGDSESCFARFYGANLPDARGKVLTCGGGAFRIVIVRDNAPRYGLVETSRGLESANLNLFGLKTLYREWTGGGHKVHTTNSVPEAEHDVFLLTGHSLSEWADGRPKGDLTVLPGQNGWGSLRELFGFLGRFAPYAVLRNAETLPDGFDPSLHGDIDLLVENHTRTANLLGARKVFPEPHRVHYEVMVGGRPVRFDFRFTGDGYYDTRWERTMLERRIVRNGVYLLHPEDAFFALVYHALYQKFEIARDYSDKAARLAEAAGLPWTDFADALIRLEDFLSRNGYGKCRPQDVSVRWNERLVSWRTRADEISALSGVTEIRPVLLEALREKAPLQPLFFSGVLNGQKCFIKHSPYARSLAAAEWKYPHLLELNGAGDLVEKSLFWHTTNDDGAFAVTEWIEGRALDVLIAQQDPLLTEKADILTEDILRIADALERLEIVHRDIRPANLIVRADGHVKLIDFQFAAPFGETLEDPWFSRHPAVIDGLGAEYAFAPGQWNDRHSLQMILQELPPSPTRESALRDMAHGSDRPTRTALCTKRDMRRLKRRYASLRRKRLLALLSSRKRTRFQLKYAQELAFLKRAIATWRTI